MRESAPGRTGRFVPLAVAVGLSNLGDGVRVVALPLLAAALTRDPLLVAGLVAAAYLPWVALALPIGVLVDRGRPALFMLVANTGRAACLAGLVVALVAGGASLPLLYLLAFLLGVGEAMHDTAAQSLVPRVVDDARLESANGTLVTMELVGQDLVGPAVAGLLFGVAVALPFGVAAGLTAASVVAACLVAAGAARPGVRSERARLRTELVSGLRWLWRDTFVRRLVLTGAALTGTTMAWEATLVLLATGPMGLSPSGYGLVLAVGSVGGVLGGVVAAGLARRANRWGLQVGAIAACGLVDLALAAFPTPWVAAIAWGVTGFAFAVWIVLSATARQRRVPEGMLARVNSAGRTLGMAATPLGSLAGGVLASELGLRAPALVSGIVLLVLAAVYGLASYPQRGLLEPAAPPA